MLDDEIRRRFREMLGIKEGEDYVDYLRRLILSCEASSKDEKKLKKKLQPLLMVVPPEFMDDQFMLDVKNAKNVYDYYRAFVGLFQRRGILSTKIEGMWE